MLRNVKILEDPGLLKYGSDLEPGRSRKFLTPEAKPAR